MKKRLFPVLAVLGAAILSSCLYDEPLAENSGIRIDPELLGLWERQPDDPSERADWMMVLKWSDTEYLVHQPAGDEGIYYRAYPIGPGGVSCIQLEVLGSGSGPVEEGSAGRFHVASCHLRDGQLVVKSINPELVAKELKTRKALQQAFLERRDDPHLFTEPMLFRRVAKATNPY